MKSRRNFIKEMLLIGIASGLSLMSKVVSLTGAAKTPKWTMIIDLNKCIACGLCVMTCTRENTSYMGVEIPLESRTRIYIVEWNGEKIPMHILCRQCTDAPCVSVCPTGASHKTAEGIVLIDHDLCIGCKYCLSVCPFDARYINEDLKAADKCTWCYHRIIKGLQPACVEICPMNARIFGDLTKPESEVSKLVKSGKAKHVGEESGVGPNVYFVFPGGE